MKDKNKVIYDEALKFLYNNKPNSISNEQLEEYFYVVSKKK